MKEPFIIVFFCSIKPSRAMEFLQDFVEEAKVLQDRRIVYNNTQYIFSMYLHLYVTHIMHVHLSKILRDMQDTQGVISASRLESGVEK